MFTHGFKKNGCKSFQISSISLCYCLLLVAKHSNVEGVLLLVRVMQQYESYAFEIKGAHKSKMKNIVHSQKNKGTT